MAYITITEARDAFSQSRARRVYSRSASDIITESRQQSDKKTFDVFLSHCMKDAEAIAGVKELLETQSQLSVYVDWIEDKDLDRGSVTKETAARIRQRMVSSQTLIFVTSETSSGSKWMPWELGYFDGLRGGRIAIFPLITASSDRFDGQEYVGLYPAIQRLQHRDKTSALYVTDGPRTYMTLSDFKTGSTNFSTY